MVIMNFPRFKILTRLSFFHLDFAEFFNTQTKESSHEQRGQLVITITSSNLLNEWKSEGISKQTQEIAIENKSSFKIFFSR